MHTLYLDYNWNKPDKEWLLETITLVLSTYEREWDEGGKGFTETTRENAVARWDLKKRKLNEKKAKNLKMVEILGTAPSYNSFKTTKHIEISTDIRFNEKTKKLAEVRHRIKKSKDHQWETILQHPLKIEGITEKNHLKKLKITDIFNKEVKTL